MSLVEVEAEIALMAIVGDAVLAAQEWLDRKHRRTQPSGDWDSAGRYEPDDTEWESCCAAIRTPSRAWPYSLWKHVHTASHVANKFEVERAEVMRAARLLERRSELRLQ